MENDKIVRRYSYNGSLCGELVSSYKLESFEGVGTWRVPANIFRPIMSEHDALNFVETMSVVDKIHMRKKAYGLWKLLQHYGVNPDDCVLEEDIAINALENGCHNSSDLFRKDRKTWKLAKQRGILEDLFLDL